MFAILVMILLFMVINKKESFTLKSSNEMKCIKHPIMTPKHVNCNVNIKYCPSACLRCPSMLSNEECVKEKEKHLWKIY